MAWLRVIPLFWSCRQTHAGCLRRHPAIIVSLGIDVSMRSSPFSCIEIVAGSIIITSTSDASKTITTIHHGFCENNVLCLFARFGLVQRSIYSSKLIKVNCASGWLLWFSLWLEFWFWQHKKYTTRNNARSLCVFFISAKRPSRRQSFELCTPIER